MPETRLLLPPFDGNLAELIAYARTLLEHGLVPLKQAAFRDLVAVAEQYQRLTSTSEPERCGDLRQIHYTPSVDVPITTELAVCDLGSGHLIQHHQGRAHGFRWFWNAHACGLLRNYSPTTSAPLARPSGTLQHLLADAEIRPLRDDHGADRIAFLKEQP